MSTLCEAVNICMNLTGMQSVPSTISTPTDICRYVQGPTWGYPTEGAYYRDASSVDSLLAIRIPFLALHAEDDPVS
jgi:predicted alpha/beta-fold hydrolase